MTDLKLGLGVVGAGLMGAEIAFVQAQAGYSVTLADRSDAILRAAMDRLHALVEKGVARGLFDAEIAGSALTRIVTSDDFDALGSAGYVTEAVFEDLDVKREVLLRLDGVCRADCVLASNTSTIPISTLASMVGADRRPLFVGTHFFSPVSRMKLVEVIPGFNTAPATLELAMQICRDAGKTPVKVKDVAGFAVNRVLHAFLIEAVRLVEEEVISVEDLDTACRLGLGHPIGPFELMDATTSRLCVQAQEIMQEAYGERFRPRPLLKQRVTAGFAGGRGQPGWRR